MSSSTSGAAALAEDLVPALEQSHFYGGGSILLAHHFGGGKPSKQIEEAVLENSLYPQRYISLDEFSLEDPFSRTAKETRFAVVIDRVPSAAAVERMASTRSNLDRLDYVLVARKDWRFKDTFRSLPYFVRQRLFLDFPVSLHHSDHFYSLTELTAAVNELKTSGDLKEVRPFCPHFHLRRELLDTNVIAVTGPGEWAGRDPELSIISSDPDWINKLSSSEVLRRFGQRVEVVIPRVIGQEAAPVAGTFAGPLSYVWIHLEDRAKQGLDIQAHLRNWGARHARGKHLFFANNDSINAFDLTLGRYFDGERAVSASAGLLLERDAFRAAGGFDPLYFYFGLGEIELLNRYLKGLRIDSEHGALAHLLRERMRGGHTMLGLRLFFHQYFDQAVFHFFSQDLAEGKPDSAEAAEELRAHSRLRYRVEQSRDAYLSLYKASPSVAVQGNLQLLLLPYHWIKPHAWRLKMPVYPIFVKPYHRIKRHLWRWKIPVYYAWGLSIHAFHFGKLHLWRLKVPVAAPYHFLKLHQWRLTLAIAKLKGNLWRAKKIYYFFFRLLFPIRKIYYFFEYQYEKRVLGLYGKQDRLISK